MIEVKPSERLRNGERLIEVWEPFNGPESWEVRTYTMDELRELAATIHAFIASEEGDK